MLRTLDTQAINPYPLMLTGTRSGWEGKQATSESKCQTSVSPMREHVSEPLSLTNNFGVHHYGCPTPVENYPPGVKTKGPRSTGVVRTKHNKGRPLGLEAMEIKSIFSTTGAGLRNVWASREHCTRWAVKR